MLFCCCIINSVGFGLVTPMSIATDSELNASSSIDRVGARSNTCWPMGLCLSGLNFSGLPFSALAGEYLPLL